MTEPSPPLSFDHPNFKDRGDWYIFVPNPQNTDDPESCVKLIKGTFSGLIVKFQKFKVDRDSLPEDDTATKARFEWECVFIPDELAGLDFPDEEGKSLETLLIEILIDIVYKDVNKNLKEKFENGAAGNTYFETVDVKRLIYKEGNPFLKD